MLFPSCAPSPAAPSDWGLVASPVIQMHTMMGGEGKTHMFGVYDGHGKHGHEVSGYVRRWLPEVLTEVMKSGVVPRRALRAAYFQINNRLHEHAEIDDLSSGTTACSVLVRGRQVVVANAGDSRAVMATYNKEGELTAVDLTRDQTTWRKDERERVEAMGACIMSTPQLQGTISLSHRPWESYTHREEELVDEHPPRIWMPGQYTPGCIFSCPTSQWPIRIFGP